MMGPTSAWSTQVANVGTMLATGVVAAATVTYVSPLAAVGLPAAALIAWWAWAYPKGYVAAAVLAVFFSPMLAAYASVFGYLDEAATVGLVLLVALRMTALRRPMRSVPGAIGFAVFGLAGLVSTIQQDVPAAIAGLDVFLVGKGLLVYVAVAQFDWSEQDVERGVRIGLWTLAVVLLMTLLNLMLGPQWYTWFSINDKVISRGGIPSPIGPFGHPGAFGQAMALTASAAIAYHLAVRRTPLTYVIVGLASLLALASLRRKAIMGVVVACGVVLLRVRRTRGAAMTVLAVMIPVLVLASGDLFLTIWSDVYDEYISGASTAARSLLYSTSFDIGLVNFPFGAGFGRFGTATAFDYYSPIYYEYGLNRNYGLAPVTGRFGTDTFWPAILGETGWIGVFGFAAGLFGIGRASSRLVGLAPSPHLRFLGLIGLAWSADAVLESSASAVYTSTPHYLLLFVIFGMVASALRQSPTGDAAAPDDAIERATDPERQHVVPGPVGVR